MLVREQYAPIVSRAIHDMVNAYTLEATSRSGDLLHVACSYQIAGEPLFRPYEMGKAPPEALQGQLDSLLEATAAKGIDPGIEHSDSLKKVLFEQGLGIDCSNFVFRSLAYVYDRLGIDPYTDTVFLSSAETLRLNAEKESWAAKDKSGNPRLLTPQETDQLRDTDKVRASWVVEVFGKDPEFIIGSKHIAAPEAAVKVPPEAALPGDLIAFTKAGKGVVSHVAVVVNSDPTEQDVCIDFAHSWHTRDFDDGVRVDDVTIDQDGSVTWSHPGLHDPTRYEGYFIARPIGLAALSLG